MLIYISFKRIDNSYIIELLTPFIQTIISLLIENYIEYMAM